MLDFKKILYPEFFKTYTKDSKNNYRISEIKINVQQKENTLIYLFDVEEAESLTSVDVEIENDYSEVRKKFAKIFGQVVMTDAEQIENQILSYIASNVNRIPLGRTHTDLYIAFLENLYTEVTFSENLIFPILEKFRKESKLILGDQEIKDIGRLLTKFEVNKTEFSVLRVGESTINANTDTVSIAKMNYEEFSKRFKIDELIESARNREEIVKDCFYIYYKYNDYIKSSIDGIAKIGNYDQLSKEINSSKNSIPKKVFYRELLNIVKLKSDGFNEKITESKENVKIFNFLLEAMTILANQIENYTEFKANKKNFEGIEIITFEFPFKEKYNLSPSNIQIVENTEHIEYHNNSCLGLTENGLYRPFISYNDQNSFPFKIIKEEDVSKVYAPPNFKPISSLKGTKKMFEKKGLGFLINILYEFIPDPAIYLSNYIIQERVKLYNNPNTDEYYIKLVQRFTETVNPNNGKPLFLTEGRYEQLRRVRTVQDRDTILMESENESVFELLKHIIHYLNENQMQTELIPVISNIFIPYLALQFIFYLENFSYNNICMYTNITDEKILVTFKRRV